MTTGHGLAECPGTSWCLEECSGACASRDEYAAFLDRKTQLGGEHGFAPLWMPDFLFDFQRHLVEWALRKGRAAILADCGLGKTPMQLVWAANVARKTDGRVLILTPLAVGAQTVAEGEKFGIDCARSRDGALPAARIVVANYEQLHRFAPGDFAGLVCDESSILKHFSGATQKAVTRFAAKLPYRLLCTATAAPNDYTELGTSSEALGVMGYTEMLSRYFRQVDHNQTHHRMEDMKRGAYFAKLAFRAAQQIGQWRLKGHAVVPFWRWVGSWARAARRPSDLGYPDDGFALPALEERHHVVAARSAPDGWLFTTPAFGLGEEREERRRTLAERCEAVAQLVDHGRPAVVWVHLNAEGDRLEKMIPGAVQVAGRDPDDVKEERLMAFTRGEARVLITKPKIAGFGLNWQHCAHVITFVSHSYESYYQAIRRCWRFGQMRPVTVDIVATEGESRVAANMARKAEQADRMFAAMLEHMHQAAGVREDASRAALDLPVWLVEAADARS